MAAVALALYLVWAVLAFGGRTLVQLRRTGDTGLRLGAQPGSAQWWSRLLFGAALAGGVAAPVVDLLGAAAPLDALDGRALRSIGLALAVLGIVTTVAAQLAMGDAWRIGVAVSERTELVTDGPFRFVRNPIFFATGATALGLALVVPNAVAIAAVAALVLALEVQVRVVEEPYLRAAHGHAYDQYAAEAGRFLPGIGRFRPAACATGPAAGHPQSR